MAVPQSIISSRSAKAAATLTLILLKASIIGLDLGGGGQIAVTFNGPVLSGGEMVK